MSLQQNPFDGTQGIQPQPLEGSGPQLKASEKSNFQIILILSCITILLGIFFFPKQYNISGNEKKCIGFYRLGLETTDAPLGGPSMSNHICYGWVVADFKASIKNPETRQPEESVSPQLSPKDSNKTIPLTGNTIAFIQGPKIYPSSIGLLEGVDLELIRESDDLNGRVDRGLTKEQENVIRVANNYIRQRVGDNHYTTYYKPISIVCSSHYPGGQYNDGEKGMDTCQEYSVHYYYSYIEKFVKPKDSFITPNMSIALRLDENRRYTEPVGDITCIQEDHICDVVDQKSAVNILQKNGAKEASLETLDFSMISSISNHIRYNQKWMWMALTGEEFSGDCSGKYIGMVDAQTGEYLGKQAMMTMCS